jgi:polyhydroxyalkanoate synthesis regulator phasin
MSRSRAVLLWAVSIGLGMLATAGAWAQSERQGAEQGARGLLEALKDTHPAVYQKFTHRLDQQEAIDRVVASYREGAMNAASAKAKLYPLVTAQIKEQRETVDEKIAFFQRHLQDLEQVKRKPDQAVQQRIERLLNVGARVKE